MEIAKVMTLTINLICTHYKCGYLHMEMRRSFRLYMARSENENIPSYVVLQILNIVYIYSSMYDSKEIKITAEAGGIPNKKSYWLQ